MAFGGQLIESILQLEHVFLRKGQRYIVADASLKLAPGTVTVVLGPSGAGKTSLLRMLNLLDFPTQGEFFFGGGRFTFPLSPPSSSFLRQMRRDVGFVFQDLGLWPHMTIMDNLLEAPLSTGLMEENQARSLALSYSQRFGLEEKLNLYSEQLSGGQQQRVALVRALMMKPKVLLIDEGTSALDPEWTQDVGGLIREHAGKGMSFVIVTHDISFAEQIADRVIFMEEGKILFESEISELRSSRNERWHAFTAGRGAL